MIFNNPASIDFLNFLIQLSKSDFPNNFFQIFDKYYQWLNKDLLVAPTPINTANE